MAVQPLHAGASGPGGPEPAHLVRRPPRLHPALPAAGQPHRALVVDRRPVHPLVPAPAAEMVARTAHERAPHDRPVPPDLAARGGRHARCRLRGSGRAGVPLQGSPGHAEQDPLRPDRRRPVRALEQALHLPAALVPDHRLAGFGQDHGPDQLGAGLPAGGPVRQARHPRHGRHTQLRLVVHRPGRAAGHGRPLHHPGKRCGAGQGCLEGLHAAAQALSRTPAGQRRHRHAQRAGTAQQQRYRACPAGPADRPAPERAVRGADHPLSRLRAGHQERPAGGLQRVLRGHEPRGARPGLGLHLPL